MKKEWKYKSVFALHSIVSPASIAIGEMEIARKRIVLIIFMQICIFRSEKQRECIMTWLL